VWVLFLSSESGKWFPQCVKCDEEADDHIRTCKKNLCPIGTPMREMCMTLTQFWKIAWNFMQVLLAFTVGREG
jgi:hypothetical protein